MSNQTRHVTRFVAALALLVGSAESFAPNPAGTTRTLTELSLLPEQGKQLVAAFNARAYSGDKYADDDYDYDYYHDLEHHPNVLLDEYEEEDDHFTATGAMRSFVSRLFHLPSSSNEEDDVVMYPVVGFQWIKSKENEYRVLPTTSAASCRIQQHHEEVVGWYSPSCSLDK